ncbi:MAG: molybdopterin synthase catalytic subunit MoaE [Hahellaceae bacterium]|nr:molybdopterin synthase catalytic subunit MoaE [Hahellaceae bacterium]MCP5168326.1 molybdopterin synthase catalytic subunit MoaE [Hahellaceae bacterium]
MIRIQHEDFDLQTETNLLRADNAQTGAICCFTGLVRDFGDKNNLSGLFLEHYPGMTEKSLQHIIEQAHERWPIQKVHVIHRIGQLMLGDQIVFVGVSSAHRQAAFAACEFIMDYLKVQAPFWKKELTQNGEAHWVDAKHSDHHRADRWQTANDQSSE